MIQPSQRQRSPKKVTTLEVHKNIASKRYWSTRLIVCSSTALVVSFLAWLVAARPAVHWGVLVLGFLIGFAVPIKSTLEWALGQIRTQIGLSYETALESQPDGHGFYDGLQTRAKESVTRLELPKTQAWWLPLLFVAIAFTLLPLIPKSLSFNGLSETTNPALPKLPTANPDFSATPPTPQDASQATVPPSPDAETPQGERTETQDAQGNLGQSSGDANRDNQLADQEALTRFLDELQQQHQQQGTPAPTTANPEIKPGASSSGANSENSQTQEQQTNPFEKITEDKQTPAESQAEQPQTGNQQSEPGQQENQSNEPSESQSPSQDASQPATQETGPGTPSDAQGNQENQGLQENGEGQGAGITGGLPNEGQNQELAAESQQEPELLSGQINGGPQNVAGTVRLPNTTNETAPVSNTVSPVFRPTDEEALTEGKIPLEYQNIVRDYFKY
jgi:hypothetical protein